MERTYSFEEAALPELVQAALAVLDQPENVMGDIFRGWTTTPTTDTFFAGTVYSYIDGAQAILQGASATPLSFLRRKPLPCTPLYARISRKAMFHLPHVSCFPMTRIVRRATAAFFWLSSTTPMMPPTEATVCIRKPLLGSLLVLIFF